MEQTMIDLHNLVRDAVNLAAKLEAPVALDRLMLAEEEIEALARLEPKPSPAAS